MNIYNRYCTTSLLIEITVVEAKNTGIHGAEILPFSRCLLQTVNCLLAALESTPVPALTTCPPQSREMGNLLKH